MDKDKRSVKIVRGYRMYVPGDIAVFPVEEARKIVAMGSGVIEGEDSETPSSKAIEAETNRVLPAGENVVQVENREIGVNTEDPDKKRVRTKNRETNVNDEDLEKERVRTKNRMVGTGDRDNRDDRGDRGSKWPGKQG